MLGWLSNRDEMGFACSIFWTDYKFKDRILVRKCKVEGFPGTLILELFTSVENIKNI
jgi:hypothetical protein